MSSALLEMPLDNRTGDHPNQTVALQFARFAETLTLDAVPEKTLERARYSILDAVGVGFAASLHEFARQAASGIHAMAGDGAVPVFGMPLRLPMRDAALLNGMLIHGIDFDDTLLQAAVHPTASLLPTILAVGHVQRSTTAEILAAYTIGLETVARLGMFGGVRLREAGHHPTSVIGIFGCALAAGRLLNLPTSQLAMAQGLALAMASGTLGSEADGASNKRVHPGWAAQSGIAAAYLAQSGLIGMGQPYEGPRGLFRDFEEQDLSAALTERLSDLGHEWESGKISTKPIPACHLTHACSDAAIALVEGHSFAIDDIKRVTARIHRGMVRGVCEPLERKRRPANAYAAQFSIPYIVAASLVRGRFTLSELEQEALSDPQILAVARLVDYEIDEESTYPIHRPGEVRVELENGTILNHREAINRGHPERPLSLADIEAKFHANAELNMSSERSRKIAAVIKGMGQATDGRTFVETICGSEKA